MQPLVPTIESSQPVASPDTSQRLKDLKEEEARLLQHLQEIQRKKNALISPNSQATNFEETEEETEEDPDEGLPLMQASKSDYDVENSVRLRSAEAKAGLSHKGLRSLPPLPNHAATHEFQGHGSEMVVTEDVIAAQNNKILNVPQIRESFAFSVVFTLGYTIYLMTAWWKCTSNWEEIFPKCEQTQRLIRFACEETCYLFWTAPVFYCMFVVVFFYQDLLCIEFFYAMLGHNVLIDYSHASFFTSYPVFTLVLWQLGGLGIYIFNWEHFFTCFMRTLPYWFPVLSASSMLCCTWDVEYRLLTLSNYVKYNFEDALHHLGSCVFLRDYVVKAGLRSLQRGKGFRRNAGVGMSIRDIVEEIEMLEKHGKLEDAKPDLHDNHLWMSEIIYVQNCQDRRSVDFRFWFRIYRCYTICMLAVLISFAITTHWRNQHYHRNKLWTWQNRWLRTEDYFRELLAGG